MNRTARLARPTIAALMMAALLGGCEGGGPALPSCGAWNRVQSPNTGVGFNSLDGVGMLSASDAWAVGTFKDMVGLPRTLTLHWNGTTWARARSPSVGANGTFLNGVSALGANDVWAVGAYRDGRDVARTYAQHWNGTAWRAVPTPNVGTGDNFLNAVAGVSATNVWAVGYRRHGTSTRALIVHWDGIRWSLVPAPTQGTNGDGLNAVSAGGPEDMWAVGGGFVTGQPTQNLILHWNGTRWSRVPNAYIGLRGNSLTGVAVRSPTDLWAVGGIHGIRGDGLLVIHGAPGKWKMNQPPSSSAVSNDLNGIAMSPGGATWAVGSTFDGSIDQTLIVRGDANGLTRVPSQNGVSASRLASVAVGPGGQAWAVGSASGALYPGRTLIEYYCPVL